MAENDPNLPEALRDARTLVRFIQPLLDAPAIIEASLFASRQVALEQNTLLNLQTEQAAAHAAITQFAVDYDAAKAKFVEDTAQIAADLEAARRQAYDDTMQLHVTLDNLRHAVEDAKNDAEEAMGQAKALAESEIAATERQTSERLAELYGQIVEATAKHDALLADIEALKAKHL